ncbi:Fanconi anemia group M protein isoform X2 [Paramisgurnus dabryanus]|uniref:Fanconi anemia group M protein isoform X2 n=1 Tax=Paramisgurnus dabryanus TaxID=90735 RepID=UPI0031F40BE3
MKANQRTLFESWGSNASHTDQRKITKKPAEDKRPTDRSDQRDSCRGLGGETFQQEDEDDDDLMLVAVFEAEKSLQASDVTSCPEEHTKGFDPSAGQIWIYPTNYPIREYQLQISEAALLQNTLVCLPTGLGKTFIASVLMYNFYRWFPAGKIVFMAPTKPLVSQQIEACFKVMGIPQQHMAELTGTTAAHQRRDLWRSKRVFFLTPQVMVNDLSRNTCPAARVKCVVIDEAHKATGNHAYCQVIRELWNQTQQFRVLALSATPGGDVKAVQQVISNLLISHIELRSEDSPDVQAHVHQRSVEKIVVPLGESLTQYQTRYLQLLERFASRLTQMRLLSHRDLSSLTKYQIILSREQFRRNPPPHVLAGQHGVLEGDFALCISLYHGYELLQQMGLRSLYLFIQNIISGPKESSRMRNELQRNPVFVDLYRDMEATFTPSSRDPKEPYLYSHPKLQKLDEVVLQHFKTWPESSGSDASEKVNTRVMIFSSFRESVQEIAEMLNRHQPLVRVMTFMGQASAGKGVRGFTQKEQLEVVRRFRDGGFNTLVSTCVGEEGLDIGEVDLIVCFDAQKSPIRLVQRMGRTGRRRQGRIVIILAEGREERTYNQSQSSRRSINKSIMGKKHSFHMFPQSPRMLPAGVTPKLHKMHISCAQFQHTDERGRSSAKGRRSSLDPQIGGRDEKRVKDDGCLTAAEEVIWTSTMKLGEDEPQPVFKQSTLLTFSDSQSAQESRVSGRVRELSLWEWRHWQNAPLPTHRVEHSQRCLHFTSIMEFIDQMRHDEQGDCDDGSEVQMNLQEDDDRTSKLNTDKITSQMRPKSAHNIRASSSKPSVRQRTHRHDQSEKSPASEQSKAFNESQDHQINKSCVMDSEETDGNDPSKIQREDLCESNPDLQPADESSDLDQMFYPSKSNFRPNVPAKTFHTVLANVKNLLSRSPPQDFDFNFPEITTGDSDPFTVKFCLTADDSLELTPQNSPQLAGNALSPGWDEMFDDVQDETDLPLEQHHNPMDLNESVDLFGDDDAFLQVSIPDVQTPDKIAVAPETTENPNCVKQNLTDVLSPIGKRPEQNSEVFNCSQDFFSVNFDLGLSFDSEEEEPTETVPAEENISVTSALKEPKASVFSPAAGVSTPLSEVRKPFIIRSPLLITAARPSASTPDHVFLSAVRRRASPVTSLQKKDAVLSSDSEDEVFVKKPAHKLHLLSSPEDSKIFSDVDSPLQVCRKRSAALNMSEDTDVDEESGDDFHQGVTHRSKVPRPSSSGNHLLKSAKVHHPQVRQFLHEEAELSENEDVSSDEDDGDEQNRSLDGFVVNTTQCSQGLNESEMQAIYLKSVRSPAVQNHLRMTYKPKHNVDIFSQVPEQDETYAEDSFVLHGSDVEEASDEEPVEMILEDSYIDGRKQYATRRRAQIKHIRAANDTRKVQSETDGRKKRSRIIRVQDSSEEEEEEEQVKEFKVPQCVSERSVRQTDRQQEQRDKTFSHVIDDKNKAQVDDTALTRSAQDADAPLSVLVDSRCISGGSEVVSSLRLRHGLKVHVCSLLTSDFIVSNRMAVEWLRESDIASVQNRRRLQDRIQKLQALHERVCLIIERDRTKPGETLRAFQHTRFYDGTLAALVRAGVRLTVSKGPDETASILSELAQVEKRKGQAIAVPLEVRGHRQQALQFFLTLPYVSYIAGLNMCHNFTSVRHVIDSSVEDLQKFARVTRSQAQEIHRCLRYNHDRQQLTS